MIALNQRIWKRAGFKSIYIRLLTIGCYTGAEQTPLRSVRNADFAEAIGILSLKNIGL